MDTAAWELTGVDLLDQLARWMCPNRHDVVRVMRSRLSSAKCRRPTGEELAAFPPPLRSR